MPLFGEREALRAIIPFFDRHPDGPSPIGQRIAAADPKAPWLTIIGIVADTRGCGVMTEARPELFVTVRQMPQFWNQLFLIVRTDGEPRAISRPYGAR